MADALLGREITVLESSGFVDIPLVHAILDDLKRRKREYRVIQLGKEAEMHTSISYSHFSQSATSSQQTVSLVPFRKFKVDTLI